ncbi:hypothetical protein LCGC14_0406310 [marine sediment metagenome]|uniref:GIY-YIG domain-containing protein n=1 Tax=marine sediment metagenome TaxID=412755 RepID=A0A0F9TDG4_9ZZZZ
MAETPTISWAGTSGEKYLYWIYAIGTSFKAEPGNYIFAKETKPNTWAPVYIGQTGNLSERLNNHDEMPCIKRNGGTHIHAHINNAGETTRLAEERDLVSKWSPPCNG